MFKFVLFLFTVCIFQGINAEIPNSEVDDAVSNPTSSKISNIYVNDSNIFENQDNFSSESSEDITTEKVFKENEEKIENSEEFASLEDEDASTSLTSTETEEYTETSEVTDSGEDSLETIGQEPLQCTLPNESLKCVKSCPRPRTCATRNLHYKCPNNENESCKDKCVCDDGFYRNSDGYCVTYDLCDKKCNGANEEYKADKKTCPLEVCPSRFGVIRYACDPKEVGQPGCVCKPGFLRNSNSTCIPKEQCPGQANTKLNCSLPNESATCVQSCPPMRTCENRNKIYHCPNIAVNASCTYQCACNDGYYRNSDGFCVTSELCDKKCPGPNEEYKADKKTCPPEICKSIVSRYACDPKEVGQPGCVCKSGFLRLTLNSTCIPTKECPELANQPQECSQPNESLKCVTSCPRPRTCATRNLHYKCPNNVNETCKNECVCDDGFYRNSDGFCVTYDLCDKKCTGANEEYKPDKKTCPLETCPPKLSVIRYACNPKEVGQPGCACKPGFLRNSNSTCIPKEQCPGQGNTTTLNCSLPNESATCVQSCPPMRTCENRNKIYHCPDISLNPPCTYQCACNDGYYRNSDGFCVTSELCDKKCTRPNEVYKADKKTCPLELCPSKFKIRYACNPHEVGKPGCVCEPGFLRVSPNSTCIPKEQCPSQDKPFQCTLPNESLKCVKSCPRPKTCATRNIHYKCPNIVNESCKDECVCDDGFYRNSNGFCVTYDLCDKKCTGPNEEYKSNKKSCPLEVCPSKFGVIHYACNPKEIGYPGCACKPGFLRNSNSTCIPKEQCPGQETLMCSLPNESATCAKSCPPMRTCENRNKIYHCPKMAVNASCTYQCSCNDGYYRNSDGFCVTSELCEPLQCTLSNESLKCVKSCPFPRTCANRNTHAYFICPNNKNETCKNECVCDDGYYRNSDGFCVTYDLCDKKCTGANEEYKADKKTCPLETCPSKFGVIRYACNPKEVGQPGCVCKPGFLRNSNSTCIPKEQCPGQGNTTLNCSLPNESSTCVPSCPPIRTCENRGKIYNCPEMSVNATCTYKCACNDGYYRNSDGFCVTSELCDKNCPRPNEVYKADKKTCPLETCPSKFKILYACNPQEVGKPGCVCKPGFLRSGPNSTCIPKEQCPNQDKPLQCTLPNESLKCVKSCPFPRTCATRNTHAYFICPNNKNETCKNECVCDDGYYRNSDGFCVTYDLCDKKCPGANEEYKADKKTCPLEACPSKFGVIRYACNPKEVGQPGCVCKPEFLRNSNSTCIPKEQCPGQSSTSLTCSLPNESATCIQSCPPMRTCENRDKIFNCPLMSLNATCTYKCACNDGFYRNSDGFCVTSDLCDSKCTGPNEVYKADKKKCPPETCESILALYKCDSKEKAQPGCVCKPGYLRLNANSICIPTSECPQNSKTPDNFNQA